MSKNISQFNEWDEYRSKKVQQTIQVRSGNSGRYANQQNVIELGMNGLTNTSILIV